MKLWELSYTIEDEKQQKSIVALYVQSTTSYADAFAFSAQMSTLISGMILGAIVRSSVSLVETISATPALGADVEECARMAFWTIDESNDQDVLTIMTIPTVNEDIFTPRGEVDQTNIAVSAFITAIADGIQIGEVNVTPVSRRGIPIGYFDEGYEYFSTRRKNKKRRWLP